MQLTDTAINNNFPPRRPQTTDDDDGPHFAAFTYPNGLIAIKVEGFGDETVDGETLLSFHPASGVEIGPSSVIAEAGEAQLTLFAGTYAEQRKCFLKWDRLARTNTRPKTFLDQGVEGLAALGPASPPPFPPIAAALTERANANMDLCRERIAAEVAAGRELTLQDCIQIAEQVDKEMITRRNAKRRARR